MNINESHFVILMLKIFKYAHFVRLTDVSLDVAVHEDEATGEPALGIEQCQCPEQYAGLSCQVGLFTSGKRIPLEPHFYIAKLGYAG